MNKQLLSTAIIVQLIVIYFFCTSVDVHATSLTINDHVHYLELSPQIINNEIMLPLRNISDLLGFDLQFNDSTKTIYLHLDTHVITHTIGSNFIASSNVQLFFNPTSIIIEERTFVPISMLEKIDGISVSWSYDTSALAITITATSTLSLALNSIDTINNLAYLNLLPESIRMWNIDPLTNEVIVWIDDYSNYNADTFVNLINLPAVRLMQTPIIASQKADPLLSSEDGMAMHLEILSAELSSIYMRITNDSMYFVTAGTNANVEYLVDGLWHTVPSFDLGGTLFDTITIPPFESNTRDFVFDISHFFIDGTENYRIRIRFFSQTSYGQIVEDVIVEYFFS